MFLFGAMGISYSFRHVATSSFHISVHPGVCRFRFLSIPESFPKSRRRARILIHVAANTRKADIVSGTRVLRFALLIRVRSTPAGVRRDILREAKEFARCRNGSRGPDRKNNEACTNGRN